MHAQMVQRLKDEVSHWTLRMVIGESQMRTVSQGYLKKYFEVRMVSHPECIMIRV